mgnify:CR=1 FL=1
MRILIVEDDPHVRLGCVQAMQLADLAVVGVDSAEAALPLLAQEVVFIIARSDGAELCGFGAQAAFVAALENLGNADDRVHAFLRQRPGADPDAGADA